MLLLNLVAQDQPGRIAGSSERKNFVSRAIGIAGNARGTRLQYSEITHTPFRSILADKHHAIAMLDVLTGKKSSDAGGEFAKVGIGVLFFMTVAFDAHRNARCMPFGRSLKELQQIPVGVNALR